MTHPNQLPKKFCVRAIERGQTLLELMTALGVAAIVLALGIPSYQNSSMNNKLAAKVTNISQALRFARSEAIAGNKVVTLCISSDFLNCTGGTNWNDGWIICTNCSDPSKSVLKVGEVTDAMDIFLTGLTPTDKVIYAQDGTLTGSGGRGTFNFCDSRGAEYAKALIINGIGRTQEAYDSDRNNILEDHEGNDITCS